jgi:hypothetical protein
MRSIPFLLLVSVVSCGGETDPSSQPWVTTPGASSGGSGSGSAAAAPAGEPATPCEAPTTVETIADLHADPNLVTGRLVVDATHLYVDTNRGTMRVRKCGGAAPVKLADNDPGQYTASGLVADADALYLAAVAPVTGGFVRRIPKNGGPATELATNAKELFGLTLAGGRLYWVERTGGADALREMRLADGTVATVASLSVAYAYGPFLGDTAGVSFFAQTGSSSGTYYTWTPAGLTVLASGRGGRGARVRRRHRRQPRHVFLVRPHGRERRLEAAPRGAIDAGAHRVRLGAVRPRAHRPYGLLHGRLDGRRRTLRPLRDERRLRSDLPGCSARGRSALRRGGRASRLLGDVARPPPPRAPLSPDRAGAHRSE